MSWRIATCGGATKETRMSRNLLRRYVSDRTVRPLARSPTIAIRMPSTWPISSRIVYRSSSACVGCWPGPSPALMTGTLLTAAARLAAPSS